MRKPKGTDFARLWAISNEIGKQGVTPSKTSVGGLSGSALLLTLFAILTNRASKNSPLSVDQNFEHWLSNNSNSDLEKFFKGFTLLGREPVTLSLSIGAFAFLQQRKQPLAAWLILISSWVGWLISRPVKVLVKRPRPLSLNTLVHHPDARSYPSGHSMVAVCFYGMLIWVGVRVLKGQPGRIGWALLMIFLILMIGLSRIYLMEHHPTDVLGGYILGSFWLSVVICSANMYEGRPKD